MSERQSVATSGWSSDEARDNERPPTYRLLAREDEVALAIPPPAYQCQQSYYDDQHIAAVESRIALRALRRSKRSEMAPRYYGKGARAWIREHRAGLCFLSILILVGAVILVIGLLQHGFADTSSPCEFNMKHSFTCPGVDNSPVCFGDIELRSIDIPPELHGWDGFQADNGTLYACQSIQAESLGHLPAWNCMMARCLDQSCEMLGPMCDWW